MRPKPSLAFSHLQLNAFWHLLVLRKGIFLGSLRCWIMRARSLATVWNVCAAPADRRCCQAKRRVKCWSCSNRNFTWTVNQRAACDATKVSRDGPLPPAVWMQLTARLRESIIPFLMSGLASRECSNITFSQNLSQDKMVSVFIHFQVYGSFRVNKSVLDTFPKKI